MHKLFHNKYLLGITSTTITFEKRIGNEDKWHLIFSYHTLFFWKIIFNTKLFLKYFGRW